MKMQPTNNIQKNTDLHCHICQSVELTAPLPLPLPTVASDCRPWDETFAIAVCKDCGTVQKEIDGAWRQAADRIYASYALYKETGGLEQTVIDQRNGIALPRSDVILRDIFSDVALPEIGSVLDIGCGTGAMLRAFSKRFPEWSLVGYEKTADTVLNFPDSAKLVSVLHGPINTIEGKFDLISLIHVLEHVEAPVKFLAQLGDTLTPDGKFLIQVPNLDASPFDLLVADHCSHFDQASIVRAVQLAGFRVLRCRRDIVKTEITLLADRDPSEVRAGWPTANVLEISGQIKRVRKYIKWLNKLRIDARSAAGQPGFGLFGTALSAGWLFGILGDGIAYFVDENPHMIGKTHFGKSVVAPNDLKSGSHIYVPLIPEVAENVIRRLERDGVTFQAPPPL